MDRMADELLNVDKLEQQYRMTNYPEDPNNIFVVKFGKNEEQHWKLAYNPTTSLMCHMQPNKLLIEQSKYNAMYIKYSLNPDEFKQEQVRKKKLQILKSKEKAKKYKIKLPSPLTKNDMSKQQTVHINETESSRPPTTKHSRGDLELPEPNGITGPSSSQGNLMAPLGDENGAGTRWDPQRGTMLVNSMLIHTDNTVANRSLTDQELLIERMQHENKRNEQKDQDVNLLQLNKPSTPDNQPMLAATPITGTNSSRINQYHSK